VWEAGDFAAKESVASNSSVEKRGGRGTMSEEKLKGRPANGFIRPGQELCMCGHSASMHVAVRYTCQAPGKRKGYCSCMLFVPKRGGKGKKAAANGHATGLRRLPS
jgi:hypothetical protein